MYLAPLCKRSKAPEGRAAPRSRAADGSRGLASPLPLCSSHPPTFLGPAHNYGLENHLRSSRVGLSGAYFKEHRLSRRPSPCICWRLSSEGSAGRGDQPPGASPPSPGGLVWRFHGRECMREPGPWEVLGKVSACEPRVLGVPPFLPLQAHHPP